MNISFKNSSRVVFWGILALSAPLIVARVSARPGPQQDNTSNNKDQTRPTADQQNENASDRATTQQIRKAIHDDKDLSTYAHNIKIITQEGKVTLRGPVRSEDEKSNLQGKAVSVAGQANVTNELTIAPSK
jgi:hyperosmotically inducible periplasmic protein